MIESFLLLAVVGFGAVAVFAKELFTSMIALAAMSTAMGGVYYLMGLTYAGAFELSAGAGLITVMFISILSMISNPKTEQESKGFKIKWGHIVGGGITVGLVVMLAFTLSDSSPIFVPKDSGALGEVLWGLRAPDVLALGLVTFAGALGISAMFHRERGSRDA